MAETVDLYSDTETLKYLFFLTRVNKLGNVRINSLINLFKSPQAVFEADLLSLKNSEILSVKDLKNFEETRSDRKKLEKEFEKLLSVCESKKINIVTIFDKDYPDNLKSIYDAPVLLYYKGRLTENDNFSIGIVGTRTPTEYGKAVCEKFSEDFSKMNIPLLSGLAKGVDSICHKTACKLDNVNYAILGCGVDVVYPPENKKLYDEVIEKGAVISEYLPGSFPDKPNFPRRNRIISGISVGTIIIESAAKGGALITANFALDQGREVFAIPGYLGSRVSEGTNNLIKRGAAKLVTNSEDVLVELEAKMKNYVKARNKTLEKVLPELTKSESIIYSILSFEPVHIDKINEVSGFNISDCLVQLLNLEFKDVVKQLPGKYFIRA